MKIFVEKNREQSSFGHTGSTFRNYSLNRPVFPMLAPETLNCLWNSNRCNLDPIQPNTVTTAIDLKTMQRNSKQSMQPMMSNKLSHKLMQLFGQHQPLKFSYTDQVYEKKKKPKNKKNRFSVNLPLKPGFISQIFTELWLVNWPKNISK